MLVGSAVLFGVAVLCLWAVSRGRTRRFNTCISAPLDIPSVVLNAGDVWWERELLSGKPQWHQLLDFEYTALSASEQAFLKQQTAVLCALLSDADNSQCEWDGKAWEYLREQRFLSMLLASDWGGLGFSAYAQSCVIRQIASRSPHAALTVIAANSLGPAELLMHYGTQWQQQDLLPLLATGESLACFAHLTAAEDAASGQICQGEYEGEQVLGMMLSFSSRDIPLAAEADIIGLAITLSDPEALLGELATAGLSCVILPADQIEISPTPGHDHLLSASIHGQNIFLPLDAVIGGAANIGQGSGMLLECSAASQGIGMPAWASGIATVMSKAACHSNATPAAAPDCDLAQRHDSHDQTASVQKSISRLAASVYAMQAMQRLSASAVDHCAPSVLSATTKLATLETLRTLLNDALESPSHYAASAQEYLSVAQKLLATAVTADGSAALPSKSMVFQRAALRCHPYYLAASQAAQDHDIPVFNRIWRRGLIYSLQRALRALSLGISAARCARSPQQGPTRKYFQQLERLSAVLGLSADLAMTELQTNTRLSALLGEVLSQMYRASAVLKYFHDQGGSGEEIPYLQWIMDDALAQSQSALDEFYANFPHRLLARFMRFCAFPWGRSYQPPSHARSRIIAQHWSSPSSLQQRLLGASAGDK